MSDGADRQGGVDEDDRYAQVLDRMIDGVLGLDTEWRLTYLNERTRELICDAVGETHTVEELVGRSFWELLPGARGTTFEERYREAMQTGETVTFDEYFAPLDVWFEVRAYPSSTGLTICFRDITERRRRREELEFREATLREMYEEWPFFRTTLDNASLALARTDFEIATYYADLADPELREEFFPPLRAEYERARDVVLDVTGRESLLKREWLDESLRRRNPYVDPLNVLQTHLLEQTHRTDAEEQTLRLTVKGIAAGMKNTG